MEKINEWQGGAHQDEKEAIKQSFWHDRDWWDENPKILTAVSKVLFGYAITENNKRDTYASILRERNPLIRDI